MQNLRIIIIICLISSVTRFVLDSYLPSLPAIGDYFAINNNGAQLTLTLYLLGFSVSQLFYGPLSDYYGRRKIILIGLFFFLSGNILCALSTTPHILFFARLMAGIGAGACGVLNRAIASDCYSGEDFSRVWSFTTTSLVMTLCIAPIIGGYVQELWNWRGNFILSTIYILIVFAIIIFYLPETLKQHKLEIFTLKTVLRNYYVVLTKRVFLTGAISYTLSFGCLIVYFQISPILFIKQLNLSPRAYGWCSLSIGLTYLLGGVIVSKWVKSQGTCCLLLWGTLLLLGGGGLMLLSLGLGYSNIFTILFSASICVMGTRIIIPNAIANSLSSLRHLNGACSALLGFIQMAGASLLSFGMAKYTQPSHLVLALFFTCMGGLLLIMYSKQTPLLFSNSKKLLVLNKLSQKNVLTPIMVQKKNN